jgi:hypothetical protein
VSDGEPASLAGDGGPAMHRIRLLIATGLLSIACFTPAVVSAAAGPAPGESCVPGTI